jgi:hypothetical protein
MKQVVSLVVSSKLLVDCQQTKHRHISEDKTLHIASDLNFHSNTAYTVLPLRCYYPVVSHLSPLDWYLNYLFDLLMVFLNLDTPTIGATYTLNPVTSFVSCTFSLGSYSGL